MSHTHYPDMDDTAACMERTRQDGGPETGAGPEDLITRTAGTACPDGSPALLQTVAAGIRNGISPLQFMAGINAGSRQLGNRAFLRWVEGLHAGGQDSDTSEVTAPILQDPNQILTNSAPLQFMLKKRRKKGQQAGEEKPEMLAEASLGASAAGEQKPDDTLPRVVPERDTEKAVIAPLKAELSVREEMLFNCCVKGDVKGFKRLVRHVNVDINMADENGTLLCTAAFYGQAAIARELLSMRGIDVNLAHWSGATPLFFASQEGHIELVQLLLATRWIKAALATPAGLTPLYIAAQNGAEEIAKLLLANPDTDINARKDGGATALAVTAQKGYPGVVKLLIKHGADVILSFNNGISPLCIAAKKGHIEVVRRLLQAPGIQVNQKTFDGATSLAVAAQYGHKDIVRLLLRKGADPNMPGNTGLTPLHVACLGGHKAIVDILLHARVDMEAEVENPEGNRLTPYKLAELAGHREVMSVLVAHRRRTEEEPAPVDKLPPCLRPQGLPLEDKRGSTTSPASPEAVSLPLATAATRAEQTGLTSPPQAERRVTGELGAPGPATAGVATVPPTPVRSGEGVSGADAPSPLAQARDALRQEVLDKLRGDNLKPLEGIRLLEDVNASTDIDGLCTLYNRLAGIERQKERARRRGRRQEMLSVAPGPAAAPVFSLGGRTGLDAEAVEDEIMRHLAQRYHRFVGQAVNDMEFGRGKPTTGYPGLWHASAGISGVGSCSVFYYLDGSGQQVRIVGAGHHVGPAAYRLDYGADELGGTVLQLMLKKKKKQEGEPEGEEKAQAAAAALPGPGGQTQSDPEAPLPQEQPGEAAGPGQKKKKKKKKSRVQVALNTLRGEGVEAFRAYVEAEIGETELLLTLVERLTRAQDLGARQDAALRVVEARLEGLDPASVPATLQAAVPVPGQVVEKAVVAPIKTAFSKRERELFECCLRGNAGRLKSLLKLRIADINMATEGGTPLCYAAYNGNTAIVRELLSVLGINVNLAYQSGFAPLYIAAQQGHTEIVRLLLAQRDIKVNLRTMEGAAALHIAAQQGHEPVVRLLLEKPGIDINARKPNGSTPLLVAAQKNYHRIVKLLIECGADVNLGISEAGSAPLIIAAMQNHVEVVRLLLQAPAIQVNRVTSDKVTALLIASQEGHKAIIELLLSRGADPDILDDQGSSPLMLACLYRHPAIFRMLLDAGADADTAVLVSEGEAITIYELARLMGHQETMSLLDAHRQDKPVHAVRPERLPLEDEPEWSTPPTSPPPEWSTPPTTPPPDWSTPPVTVASLPVPAVSDSRPLQADTSSTLAKAKNALIQEVLKKLDNDTLEPLEGIRLMVDVRAATEIDMLSVIYNRLAGMERQLGRTRRRRPIRPADVAAGAQAMTPNIASPQYALGDKANLDADAVEDEIRKHLDQSRHRFVSQAVNDMEFGRGKPTSGYPGLLHASAGIPGVGSCSVFYYGDAKQNRIRIVGIGHHLDAETYRLDYAHRELGGSGRILRLA